MDSFLQSSVWADFQKSLGRRVWQVDSINIIKYNLPFGKSYLYSPRPNFAKQNLSGQARCEEFLNKIKEIAKKENAIFFKIEPEEKINEELLKKSGFKKGQSIQPSKTLILDITKSEKELLAQMHHKARYNIRLAERKGIKVRSSKFEVRTFNKFWELLQQTTKRDGFHPHPKEYYKKMLEIPGVELFVATFRERVVAVNIAVFYKETAIYLHGASDYQYRNLMAPHLLQWQQILEAKKRGCAEYDFWGINGKKWPGVTRFKKGFAPQSRSDLRGT